jgi:hypothetical protein
MQVMRDRGIAVAKIAKKFNCSVPCVYSNTSKAA